MKPLKTIKDPVHGFINIESPLILWLLDHPYFQRLRRIRQLGTSDFVYPGALHTRFHHALGAMSLMQRAIHELQQKNIAISPEEREGAQIAILLHDIGHGPFSHVLENTILDVRHEYLSLELMEYFNRERNGALHLAIQMFKNTYERKFFHQLISSQLDMDRLDYLQRDCFFTGVSEGNIGVERILKVLNVVDDQIVASEKGIYNIEHFLNARRMMYWQVYLHKTNVGMEQMLAQVIGRARALVALGENIFSTPAFGHFLNLKGGPVREQTTEKLLVQFAKLDDYDIWASLKVWADHEDRVLSFLARSIINRNLFHTDLAHQCIDRHHIEQTRRQVQEKYKIEDQYLDYFVRYGKVSNSAYLVRHPIQILKRNGEVANLDTCSDLPNIKALMQPVQKYFFWHPKL